MEELQLNIEAMYKKILRLASHYQKRVQDKHIYIGTFVISLVLLVAGIIAVHFMRAYTSDDVIIQTILYQHTHLAGHANAWLGEDNYIIKVPFYLLMHALFQNSRRVLLVTSTVFNVLGFGLFFYSFVYFAKRFRVNLTQAGLCFVWFFSLSIPIVWSFLINPNLRNLEIGLYFIILMLFAKYLDGKLSYTDKQKWALAAAGVVLLGLFFYNDPFFVYMLGLPLILFFAWRLYFQKFDKKILSCVLFIILAFGFAGLWHALFQHFGVYSRQPQTAFISFAQLGITIPQAMQSYFMVFSASFWSRAFLSINTFRILLNAILMSVFVFAPLTLLFVKKARKTKDLWPTFWLLQPLYITLIFIVSTNTTLNGLGAVRFLALAPFYAPISIALVLNHASKRIKTLAIITLTIAILLNTIDIGKQLLSLPTVSPNAQNYAIINAVEQQGLQKGFGQYWDSSINTYLSNNKIVIIPANCLDIQHFLMDDKTLGIAAKRSFYLYNTRYQQCDLPTLFAKLGKPAKTVNIDSQATLFIYNYDITSLMNRGYYYQKP